MATDWVDFRAVKSAVSMSMILAKYNIDLRRVNADSIRGPCPLPTHSSGGEHSFSVNVTKNAWACQSKSCVDVRGGKKGGNVLDFVAVMENMTVRDAAIRIANWFNVSHDEQGRRSTPAKRNELAAREKREVTDQTPASAENKPLGFALSIDYSHPYATARNLSPETVAHFGVGFFPGKGSMSGRFVIPIANGGGEIVAYAGRATDGAEPKYKFPAGFQKSLELWNLHRVLGLGGGAFIVRNVIVVEGFFDAMRVHQAGFPNVVALMGSSMSHEQEKLLAMHFRRVVLALDGDETGRQASDEIALRLARSAFARIAPVPAARQPDELGDEERDRLFRSCG